MSCKSYCCVGQRWWHKKNQFPQQCSFDWPIVKNSFLYNVCSYSWNCQAAQLQNKCTVSSNDNCVVRQTGCFWCGCLRATWVESLRDMLIPLCAKIPLLHYLANMLQIPFNNKTNKRLTVKLTSECSSFKTTCKVRLFALILGYLGHKGNRLTLIYLSKTYRMWSEKPKQVELMATKTLTWLLMFRLPVFAAFPFLREEWKDMTAVDWTIIIHKTIREKSESFTMFAASCR